ncbi:hypothetical protein [Hyphomicrobium sp.]|mgnify:CR=1 FL=1|uniref:hypothetical protein n=1 Tax=Hyphomicrobium sp. TaxID=82 RepID=UPI002FE34CDE
MGLSGVRQFVRENRDAVVGLLIPALLNFTFVAAICYLATLNYLSAYGARFPGEGIEFIDFILYGQAAWVTALHAAIFLALIIEVASNDFVTPSQARARLDIFFIGFGAILLAALFWTAVEYYKYGSLQGRVLLLIGNTYHAVMTYLTSVFGSYQRGVYAFLHLALMAALFLILSKKMFRVVKRRLGAYAFIPILISAQAVFWLNNDAFAGMLRWTKYGGGLCVETLLYTGQNACDVTISGHLVVRTKTTVMLVDDNKDLIEIETKNVCRLRYIDQGTYRREFKLGSL